MKIKYIWEEEDIIAGRWIKRQGVDFSTAYKIGYAFPKPLTDRDYEETRRYVLIAITDGMVTSPQTKKEMAELLTKDNRIPLEYLELIGMIAELIPDQGGPKI